jgi:hypothetical protein
VDASLRLEAFEYVRDQVGACGIWCGSCVVGNGALRELTRRYELVIQDYGLPEWGPGDVDYGRLMQDLAGLTRLRLCPGCRRGGGRDNCEIRACAARRRLESCRKCRAAACEHKELLEHMRSGALEAGLCVDRGDHPREDLVRVWTAELQSKWPSCVLFTPCE